MKKMKTIGAGVLLKCCGCSGDVAFTGASPVTFWHALPFCTRFERVNTVADVAAYVHDCRIMFVPLTEPRCEQCGAADAIAYEEDDGTMYLFCSDECSRARRNSARGARL